jgi:hypothetical protein
MAASDQWDLLTSAELALVANEQILGGLLLLSIDVIRDRHVGDVGIWRGYRGKETLCDEETTSYTSRAMEASLV